MAEQNSNYTFLWSDYQPDFDVEKNINSIIKFPEAGNGWNEVKNIIMVSRENRISCYHSNADLINDRERGKKLFDEKFFAELIKEVETNCADHQAMFGELRRTDLSKLSNQEIFDWYIKMADRWSQTLSYFRFNQAEGVFYLIEEIKKHLSPDEASILMLSPKLDAVNLEQIDWQEIIKKPFDKEVIFEHIYKYPWVVALHFTYEDALETLKQRYEFDKSHLVYKDIVKEKSELLEKQNEILNKNPQLRWLAGALQRIALSRTEVKSCWAGSDFYFISIFEEIAKRTGEDIYDLWKFYCESDLKEVLLNGRKLAKEIKENREKCFVGLWKNGKVNYFEGDEAEKIAKDELGSLYKIKEQNEFKGVIANPGRAKGIAHLVWAGDMEDTRNARKTFQKGEILITQMTQPNIMDIASKAGAIITDEGGMLSHAAIISRELKIPCIVGTHFATTLIKTGDLIEVDAEKGIVKILERK